MSSCLVQVLFAKAVSHQPRLERRKGYSSTNHSVLPLGVSVWLSTASMTGQFAASLVVNADAIDGISVTESKLQSCGYIKYLKEKAYKYDKNYVKYLTSMADGTRASYAKLAVLGLLFTIIRFGVYAVKRPSYEVAILLVPTASTTTFQCGFLRNIRATYSRSARHGRLSVSEIHRFLFNTPGVVLKMHGFSLHQRYPR